MLNATSALEVALSTSLEQRDMSRTARRLPEFEHQSATALSDTISSIVKSSVLVIRRVHVRVESPRPGTELGDGQGRKRVIQRRFNVSVPRARVSETAPALRERSER